MPPHAAVSGARPRLTRKPAGVLEVEICGGPRRARPGDGLLHESRPYRFPHAVSLVAVLLVLALAACDRLPRQPRDLTHSESALVEATAAQHDRDWVRGQVGRILRLNDDVRRTLPAGPPSRLRFAVDIPKSAHLVFGCGIPPEYQGRPGVEYVVKVRRTGGDEEVVWTDLVDPLRRPAHHRWVDVDVDLSKHAGRGTELVLETRGFEEEGEPRRAFWATPALTVRDDRAPLAIVYLVDTLRADHTTPYGYTRDTTPELARFAKDAVVFDKAISQASWTKPAVASILTSLLPGRHRAVQLRDALDSGIVRLPEMLQTRDYATGAAIANSVIYSRGTNFEKGFDFYAGLHGAGDRPSKVVEAGPVVDTALKWLDTRRGFPRFLYVHTMDPHVPYTPPAPFDRKYEPHPAPGQTAEDPRNDYHEPLDRDRMIAQYDGEIAYGDQEFGRFIRELKARGLYDRALIVFIGDHGEEFQDHGQWTHGKSVFDELIRVPLVVKFPQGRDGGRRITQQVQSVDVLPTVLESLGLPVPAAPVIVGHPLQAVVKGGAPEPPAVSEISHRGYVAHGMRTNKDKYVQRFSPDEDELYFDLVRDPRETVNRAQDATERVRFMRAGVEAAMVPNPFRNNLRVVGSGVYELKLRTGGWIEGVEGSGLGEGERYEAEGNGRKLYLTVKPKPGRPREIAFSVRPMGAPVWLEGTHDGQPLKPLEVLLAREAVHPPQLPCRLPELEVPGDSEGERNEDVFNAPPEERPGVHLWLTLASGRGVMDFDKETRERLKALGYLGN
jgi:arylsulfatase A-like enzyme